MSRSYLRWLGRIAIGAVVVLVAGFAVGSLAGSKRPANARDGVAQNGFAAGVRNSAVGSGASVVTGVAGVAPGFAPSQSGGGQTTAKLGALQLPGATDQVIKTADLGIEVAKGGVDRAWDRVFAIAARYGGFVLSSSQGSGGPVPVPLGAPGVQVPQSRVSSSDASAGDTGFADIVIRVPANRFDQALADLASKDLGTVTRRGTSGQDVSQEFVDLGARLRNERTQEAVLLTLMARAKTVGETIAVQQQLSEVQGQIEEITGRIRYLKDQTQLATISVHLAEKGAAAIGSVDGPSFSKAWHTAMDGLVRMGSAGMIAGIWLAPFALLAAVILATRRSRQRPAPQA